MNPTTTEPTANPTNPAPTGHTPTPPARRNSLLTITLEIPGNIESKLREMCRTWEDGEITKTHLAIEALGCLIRGVQENHAALALCEAQRKAGAQ